MHIPNFELKRVHVERGICDVECVEIICGRAHVELTFVQRSQLAILSICYEIAECDVTEEEHS